MLYKKLLAILVLGVSSCTAFANSADEYVQCEFSYRDINGFQFSKLGNSQEVNSDFGSTTKYDVDSDGRITWAQSTGLEKCDLSDPFCSKKSWQFYKNNDGKWTIQGTVPAEYLGKGSSINVYDAICTSSSTHPQNNVPW